MHELQSIYNSNPKDMVTLGSGGSEFNMKRILQVLSPSKRTVDTVDEVEPNPGNLNVLVL